MKQSSFKELVRLVLGQPFRMSLMLVGTLVQVLLTVYLPILIGLAVDAVLIADGQVLDQGHQVGLGCHEDLLRSSAIYQEIDRSQHREEDSHETI